jgi:hypothetical protein
MNARTYRSTDVCQNNHFNLKTIQGEQIAQGLPQRNYLT